jgi:hypothetical protein
MPVAESELDRLYALPLAEFVGARKELAKKLKAAGDAEAAREALALPRPALAAWVLNQLSRREREVVAAVLASLDRQRELQLGALDGALDAAALTKARAAEREAVATARDRAAALLEEGGHAASKTNLDRVLKALRAAALDPASRDLLERGRLLEEEVAGGFDAVASQLDPAVLLAALRQREAPPPPARKPVDAFFARSARAGAGDAEPRRADAHRQEDAERDAARRREEQKRDKAERKARAKAALADTRAALAAAETDADQAEAKLAALERELETARTEARRARRKAGQLRVELDDAEKRQRILDD